MHRRSFFPLMTAFIAFICLAATAAGAATPAVAADQAVQTEACLELDSPQRLQLPQAELVTAIRIEAAGAPQCECALGLCPGLPCPRCNYPLQCESQDCFTDPNEEWVNGVCL